jgi:hypothetical protein
MVNGPRGFLIPILYSEIFGKVPTRDDLLAELRKVDWRTIVTQVVGILCISWQDGVEEGEQQKRLVVAMIKDLPYRNDIAKILQNQAHRRLFTREGLVGMLRVAVVEGSTGNGNIDDQADAFTKAALIVNELLAAEIMLEEATNGPSDLMPTELRSAVLQLENPHDLLGRSDAFFTWAQTDKAKGLNTYSDIAKDLERFTRLTPLEFLAGAYFTFARYSSMVNWEEVERTDVVFSIAEWQAGMADTRVIRQWIGENDIPLDKIRAEWAAQKSLSFAALGSVWTKPVIQVKDDLFFVPVPALVGNMLNDGLYFTLFDAYGAEAGNDKDARKRAISKFTGFFGAFFEDHIAGIFEKAYKDKPDRRFSREKRYDEGGLSTDIVIAEGNDVIFLEVVSKRMTLRDSVVGLKPEAIERDIEDGVMHKAQQINDNIRKFRNRELLPDWPRPEGQRFFPIVVAPQDRPRINIITTDLAEAQAKAKDTGGFLDGAEPLELLDLGEVEQLENGLVAGVSLARLLTNKNNSSREHRLWSLHNYLYYVEPDLLPAGLTPTRQRGGEVALRIMELAKTWVAGAASQQT